MPRWGAAVLSAKLGIKPRPYGHGKLVGMGRAVVAVAVFVAITIAVTVTAVIAIPTAAVIIVPVARPRAPFAVAAIDYFEVGATAAIDPYAVAVISPGAVENAIGFTALAHDEDTIQRIYSAEIALHVIGGAIDQGGGASLPVAGNGEVRAAATIRPNTALAVTPGLALDAGSFAALANQAHAEAGIRGAPNAFHVIGSAIDHVSVAPAAELALTVSVATAMLDDNGSLNANLELRAAATIDPDASIVIAPGAILNALGFAFLVDHLYSAGGIDGANVTTHVIGRTRHPQGLRHGSGLSGPGSRCNREQECSRNQSKRCRNELVRASAKTLHGEASIPFRSARLGVRWSLAGGSPAIQPIR